MVDSIIQFRLQEYCLTLLCYYLQAKLLEEVVAYCKQFSNNIGHPFTKNTIRLSALTGAAATEIGGNTTSSEYGLNSTTSITVDAIADNKDTRLHIIDEISFADHDTDLEKLSSILRDLTECRQWPYGDAIICFLGDFLQLEPVGGNSAYKHPQSQFWEQALTSMVELKGTHRFSGCPVLKHLMPALRDNGLTEAIRAKLNKECLTSMREIPVDNLDDLRFATYFNYKRAELNRAVFLSCLQAKHSKDSAVEVPKSAIVIKCDAS